MGLQHSLAMVGGIITPPLLVGAAANNVRTQQFLISSSLIVSGICTVIHCIQLKIPFTGGRLFYGTGAIVNQRTSVTASAQVPPAHNSRPKLQNARLKLFSHESLQVTSWSASPVASVHMAVLLGTTPYTNFLSWCSCRDHLRDWYFLHLPTHRTEGDCAHDG
jgi:hypothetical protein